MSSIKRRHFLHRAGSTLAAIGLSQFDFLYQADRYGRVVAQSTHRKLALLVGINHYQGGIRNLNGCLTDVDLQKYLLIHRFGFDPKNILEITNRTLDQPTRENILTAFREHLIKQAKPNDVVVFHYSGHGALVRDPNPIRDENYDVNNNEVCQNSICQFNGTIVPMDASAISETDSEIVVPDIMGRTLFLLMSAIQTENLTVILDSCHSGAGTRGNVVVRAADRATRYEQSAIPSPAELEYQEQLRSELNLSLSAFQQARQQGIAKGVALGSAQRNQEAIDTTIGDDIYAGGFTYLLTRYLWQQTSNDAAATVYPRLALSTNSLAEMKRRMSQIPIFEYKPNSNNDRQPLYFLQASSMPSEAVITKVDSHDQIEFWLGGVASQSLQSQGKGNTFAILDATGTAIGEIEQTGRKGLYGYGKLTSNRSPAVEPPAVEVNHLLRERIVGLPA
ncbi:MAG: hypothetical protein HC772_20290 [Leptolyngbyaceae cyanobacterium CRU_2_3]|nr:hypothetical protein [Leptolyngbyaceae cyanobacterium CRU_2_3]